MHLGRHCAEVRKAPTRREICKAGDGNNSLCRQLHADFPGQTRHEVLCPGAVQMPQSRQA